MLLVVVELEVWLSHCALQVASHSVFANANAITDLQPRYHA